MSSWEEEDDYGGARRESVGSDDENGPEDGPRSDDQSSDNDNDSSSSQQDQVGDNDSESGDGDGTENSGENNEELDSNGSDPEGDNCAEDNLGEEGQDETEQLDNSSDNDNSDYEARDAINVDLEYAPNVNITLERDAEEGDESPNECVPQPVQTVQRQTHCEDSASVRPRKQHIVEPVDDSDNERTTKHHSHTSLGTQLATAVESGFTKAVGNTVEHAAEGVMSGMINQLFHHSSNQPPQAAADPVPAHSHSDSHPSSKPATQGVKTTASSASASAHKASRTSDDKKATATGRRSKDSQNPTALSADAHEKPKQKSTKLAEPAVGKKSTGPSSTVSRKV